MEEMNRLKWSDIELDSEFPSIICSEDITKNGKEKTVPLVGEFLHFFKKWKMFVDQLPDSEFLDRSDREYVVLCTQWHGQKEYFRHPIRPGRSIYKAIRRVREKFGIDDLEFYGLKHTFISATQKSGMNPLMIQKIVGHSSLQMTNHYTQFEPKTLYEQLAKAKQDEQGKKDKNCYPNLLLQHIEQEMKDDPEFLSYLNGMIWNWQRYRDSNPGLMAENNKSFCPNFPLIWGATRGKW